MQIVEVISRKDLGKFIAFPDKLYASCPQYVPALHEDQLATLTSNAALEYCTQKMWMALDDEGQVTGRINAMINPRYNELYGKKCCRFGWFDVVEDFEVAKALIDKATGWAREQGMTQIHGPLFYNTLGKQGMLVEGFENTPQATTLYNYPYYPRFLEKMGFEKECDWLQYKVMATTMTDRVRSIAQRLKQRYNLHSESIEKLKKDPRQVEAFFSAYNESFSRSVYNFIPFTEAEIRQEASSVMPLLSDRYCTVLCEENGDIAAFAILFPSLSEAMKKARGHMFPLGWYHILRALKSKNNPVCDFMLIGAVPKWDGKGLTASIHLDVEEKMKHLNIQYNITNPQFEDNKAVNVWETYPHELYMRRRCYIKDID